MQDIDAIQAGLDAVRADALRPAHFSQQLRASPVLAQLPPRFGEVAAQLLDSLEASALFTEESCSFSQRDLLDALQGWIDKARARLA